MTDLLAAARQLAVDEEGAALIEHALLVGLLAGLCVAILYGLGQNLQGTLGTVNGAVKSANAGITSAS